MTIESTYEYRVGRSLPPDTPSYDDFFSLLKTCSGQRPRQAAYNRISFALIGFATPIKSIQDRLRSPSDIGQLIESP